MKRLLPAVVVACLFAGGCGVPVEHFGNQNGVNGHEGSEPQAF